MAARHIRESIRLLANGSWAIGGRLMLTRAISGNAWTDNDGTGYQITEPQQPVLDSQPLSSTGEIQLVHDVADASAVFSIGESAFCKVKIITTPEATREHVTLSWLHQHAWSFAIPTVFHHAEFDGRYYIFLSRVPGETLDAVWNNLLEPTRDLLAKKIAYICKELAVPASQPIPSISGADGNFLTERYLGGEDCSPPSLQRSCAEMGMDCSALVFYHCDLGPTNILVDVATCSIGIIDWETAGFVPVEWIQTKFRVSAGMDLSGGDTVDWRRRVSRHLDRAGYDDVADAFMARLAKGRHSST